MEPALSEVQIRDSESNAAGSLLSAYREIREEVVEAPQPIVVMMGHVVDCFVVHFGAVPRHRESQPGVSQMALPQKLNQG